MKESSTLVKWYYQSIIILAFFLCLSPYSVRSMAIRQWSLGPHSSRPFNARTVSESRIVVLEDQHRLPDCITGMHRSNVESVIPLTPRTGEETGCES